MELIDKLLAEQAGIKQELAKQKKLFKVRTEDLEESKKSLGLLKEQIKAAKAKDCVDIVLYAQLVDALDDTVFLQSQIEEAILEAAKQVEHFEHLLSVNEAYIAELQPKDGKVIYFDRQRSTKES